MTLAFLELRFRRSVCVSDEPRLEGQRSWSASPSQAKLCPAPSSELKVRKKERKTDRRADDPRPLPFYESGA